MGIPSVTPSPQPIGFLVMSLPATVTVAIIIQVVKAMRRGGGMVMAISAILSIVAAVLALQTYYAMARGAFGTYLGFYLTGLAGLFALVQRAAGNRALR